MSEKVPQALIDKVPVSLKQKSCICQACIRKNNIKLAKSLPCT